MLNIRKSSKNTFTAPEPGMKGNGVPATVSDYFDKNLSRHLNKPALIPADGNILTFQNLCDVINKLATALKNLLPELQNENPDQDIVIGVCIPPSIELVATLFAILKTGAAYLPYDNSFPIKRIEMMTQDCRPVIIISSKDNASIFTSVSHITKVVITDELLDQNENNKELQLSHEPKFQSTAIVMYTSGSSGTPKGVRLTHKAILNRLEWQWREFPYEFNEKCVLKTSLTFGDSIAEIFGPLLQGVPLVLIPKTVTSNPLEFIKTLGDHKITRIVLVPSLLRAFLQTMKLITPGELQMATTLKLWVVSGEPISKDLIEIFFQHFSKAKLCNFYGSTEVTADATYVTFSSIKELSEKTIGNAVPIGEPIMNTKLYVLDENLKEMKLGQSGEICISGILLASGYVGYSNSDKFIKNPYEPISSDFGRLFRTGDFGHFENVNGRHLLMYDGRIDTQIKVRGHRVDLSEIQMTMKTVKCVKEVVVLCYQPNSESQTIVAFIVPEADYDLNAIVQIATQDLREYERPTMCLVNSIPLLVNGKVDRQSLLATFVRQMQIEDSELNLENCLNIDDNKKQMAHVFIKTISTVISISRIMILNNFDNSLYSIGGTSLNSITIVLKLREQSLFVSITNFVNAKSIREIFFKLSPIEKVNEQEPDLCEIKKSLLNAHYSFSPVTASEMEDVKKIISYSFSQKGDVEKAGGITYDDIFRYLSVISEDVVKKGYSFLVRRKLDNEIVGCSINFDFDDRPNVSEAVGRISYKLEMMESMEREHRLILPQGKGILFRCGLFSTAEGLHASENILVVEFMENKVIEMARDNNFAGVIASNSSMLTKDIAALLGYQISSTLKPKYFVAADGSTPFHSVSEDVQFICSLKILS